MVTLPVSVPSLYVEAARLTCSILSRRWLPANASTNHQGCKAGSHSYHWIETGKGTCTLQGNCRFWVKNIATNEPDDVAPPNFPEDGADYIVQGLDIGNGPYGRMAVSYVDGEEQGGYGVGTRQMLSFDPELYGECTTAFDTLSRVAAKHRPEIEFDLVNPCTKAQKGGLARIGGYALGILTKQLVLY